MRRQAPPHWYEQVERGLVAICEPVVVEALAMADTTSYQRVEDALRSTYPWVVVPDNVWDLVATTRRSLAAESRHQGLPVADHLMVATALRHGLTVLYEDADFQTVAGIVPGSRSGDLPPHRARRISISR